MSHDRYFQYLQEAADLQNKYSLLLMPHISRLRSDEYNYIFWVAAAIAKYDDKDLSYSLFNLLQEKTNRSLDSYFDPKTLYEKQMLSVARSLAESIGDIDFICLLANFFWMGEDLYEAQKYYNLAKEKGCTDVDEILSNISSRIEDLEDYSYEYYEPYEHYSREDSFMDALDGQMDAYWNID